MVSLAELVKKQGKDFGSQFQQQVPASGVNPQFDRQAYGAGIMAARAANNPNIDPEGYNREVLNRIYGPAFVGYGNQPDNYSQIMIDRIMDMDQRDQTTPIDTRELGQYTEALNAANTANLSSRLVDDMYLPSSPDDILPEVAFAMSKGDGMVAGQNLPMANQGVQVKAGDLYGDPSYSGNYGTMTPSFMYQDSDLANPEDVYNMGRGNPFLKDLSYTMAGPSTNYFDEILDDEGNVEGYSMNRYPDDSEFRDPGYEIRDVNQEIQNEVLMDELRDRMRNAPQRGIEGLRRFLRPSPFQTNPYSAYGSGI